MEYIWLTNYDIRREMHTLMCLEQLGLQYEIRDEATDVKGNIIENYKSVYVVPEADKQNEYFDISYRISMEYQDKMIDSGFCTYEETLGKYIYVGCEKEYFPERDASLLA